jgi:hypothetical protein
MWRRKVRQALDFSTLEDLLPIVLHGVCSLHFFYKFQQRQEKIWFPISYSLSHGSITVTDHLHISKQTKREISKKKKSSATRWSIQNASG